MVKKTFSFLSRLVVQAERQGIDMILKTIKLEYLSEDPNKYLLRFNYGPQETTLWIRKVKDGCLRRLMYGLCLIIVCLERQTSQDKGE